MSTLNPSRHFPNLTPIRFILALLVVIFHIAQFSKNREIPFYNDLAVFHKGMEAVYMFFSLSGFLIIRQLFIEKQRNGSIRLKSFYKRRALRIFPLYYLVLIFGFLYYHFILPFFGFPFENNYDLLSGIALSVTFFPNIFSTYAPGGILEILWSIGIEEQFYLFIAPLFLLLPLKRIVMFLVFFSVAYFLLYFSEYLVFLKEYKMLFFYFSFGGLCSILFDHAFMQQLIRILKYPGLAIFILYFTTGIFVDHLNEFSYQLFSFVLFGFVIACLATQPIKFLQSKAMNHLGKISYGIYMYHSIVIHLVGLVYLKVISKLDMNYYLAVVLINVLVISITILISHYSYTYYECYFLKLKQTTRKKRNDTIMKGR